MNKEQFKDWLLKRLDTVGYYQEQMIDTDLTDYLFLIKDVTEVVWSKYGAAMVAYDVIMKQTSDLYTEEFKNLGKSE